MVGLRDFIREKDRRKVRARRKEEEEEFIGVVPDSEAIERKDRERERERERQGSRIPSTTNSLTQQIFLEVEILLCRGT